MQANKFLNVVLKFWDYAFFGTLTSFIEIFSELYWTWCLWTVCQALCNILGFFTNAINFQFYIFFHTVPTTLQLGCNFELLAKGDDCKTSAISNPLTVDWTKVITSFLLLGGKAIFYSFPLSEFHYFHLMKLFWLWSVIYKEDRETTKAKYLPK